MKQILSAVVITRYRSAHQTSDGRSEWHIRGAWKVRSTHEGAWMARGAWRVIFKFKYALKNEVRMSLDDIASSNSRFVLNQ